MQHIRGHQRVYERFCRAAEQGRLTGSFLFVGPGGVGKRTFAVALAKSVLCKGKPETSLVPCERCDSCRLFNAPPNLEQKTVGYQSPHPDFYYICKPPDKSELPLELIIGAKEQRGRSGLCCALSRTPYLGHRKVAVIDDADFLNEEGANALLKTLEEPPPDTILILIGTSSVKQLPTIRSRCKIVRFAPLAPNILATLLLEQGSVTTQEQGLQLAVRSNGGLEQARDLFDETLDEKRGEWNRYLSAGIPDSVTFAQQLNVFVDKVGKDKTDASPKRRRLRQFLMFAVEHYRNRIRQGDTVYAPPHLERTLDALEQIERNANLPLIVDAWCTAVLADTPANAPIQ